MDNGVELNSTPQTKKRCWSTVPAQHDILSSCENTVDHRSRRSSIQKTNWSLCIICQKLYCKREKRVHQIESFERATALKEASVQVDDKELTHRVRDEDLIARGALYHRYCLQSLLKRTSISPKHSPPHSSPHDTAFQCLLSEVEDEIFKGKAFFLTDLIAQYRCFLPDDFEREEYKACKLQEKLIKHFGESIVVHSQRGQGKSNIIISSNISVCDALKAVTQLENDLEEAEVKLSSKQCEREEMSLLHEAATILKRDMTSTALEPNYPSASEVDTESSKCIIPPSLLEMITWLLDDKSHTLSSCPYTPAEETTRRALSIAECILFCSGIGLPPQHVGLAVHLHHEYGSRSLINTLHSFGFCIGYDELRRLLTSTAQQEMNNINNGVYLPSGIIPMSEGGCLVHEGDDNIDINAETIDGKNTFHSMARVVFQEQSGPQNRSSTQIKRGKEKSLPLSAESKSLMQCKPFVKPPKRQAPPSYNSPCDKIQSCKLDVSAQVRELSWIFMRFSPCDIMPETPSNLVSPQEVPFWSGFNSQISECHTTHTAIAYAPIIDAKPADLATVYTTMCHAKDMSERLGQEFTIQTMDQQLFAVAQQVKWSLPAQFSKHIIRLGGFHALACFISAIGKLWGDGGLRDMLTDSDVYAGCTVDQMLRGKQFNRAVRGLTLAYEALSRLQLCSFVQWCKTEQHVIPEELWNHLLSTRKEWMTLDQPSKLLEISKLDDLLKQHVLPLLHDYRAWGSRISPTFKYWDMFLQAVQIMLLNIRAEREGNWILHLQTSAEMLPYFFCTDRVNYSRWTPLYILDMLQLPDSIRTEFEKGKFAVREVPGSFNAIWSDMATEKTVIRDAKSDSGIVGLTRKTSALMRWVITRHITASYSRVIKGRAGEGSSDVHSHKQTKPASLKQDEAHVVTLVNFIKSNMVNPFEVNEEDQQSHNTLINISTGMHATKEVQQSLLNAIDLGKQQCHQFVARAFLADSDGTFYGPISRSKVKTFTDMTRKTKVHQGGILRPAHIHPELIFRRALAISTSREDVSFDTVMTLPMGAVPPALFHQDGTMRKTTKADLTHKLEEEAQVVGELPPYNSSLCQYIRDAMAVIQFMTFQTYRSFDDVAQHYMRTLLSCFRCADTIVDVFDQYDVKGSVKSAERQRRAGAEQGSRIYTVKAERPVPPWKRFLASGTNKKSLCDYICQYIVSNGPSALEGFPNRRIILAGGFKDGLDVKCITSQGISNMSELRCNHEEADTRMLLHAIRNQSEKIIIRSPDTDVLVLAIHYFPKMNQVKQLWIETGTKAGNKYSHRYIPVHDIVKVLGPITPSILPAFHSLTGCDSTSSIAGIGKKSAYRTLKARGPDNFVDLQSFGTDDVTTAKKSAFRLFAALYNPKGKEEDEQSNINSLRIRMAKRKDVSLEKLPPCDASFEEHVKRCMWQTKIWTSSHITMQTNGSPEDYGWYITDLDDDMMVPKFFEGHTAAEVLKGLVCCCTGQRRCITRCTCQRDGLPCTDLCLCANESTECFNKAIVQPSSPVDEESRIN